MLLAAFPRVKLDTWPTPLQHLPRFGESLSHSQLYMKRDDVMRLGLGGNKVRKLEYWLGEALKRGADVIIAAGGEQSNLTRLTAAACAKLGLECMLVHNCNEPETYQANMLLCNLFGAQAIFLGDVTEFERDQATLDLVAKLEAAGRRPYVINNEFCGILGYTQCALELYTQAEAQHINLKHVVIVGAMGITAGGFLFGTALLAKPFHVHVISVEYPLPKLQGILKNNFEQLIQLTGLRPNKSLDDVMTLYQDWMGEGWGKPTSESLTMIRTLAQTEGIIMDHVYNAKTVAGLKGLISKGIIPRDEAVCVIHTGGVPAVFGHSELLHL